MKRLAFALVLAAGSVWAYQPTDWSLHAPKNGLKAETSAEQVVLRLAALGFARGGDGFVSAELPLYRKGRLDFDVKTETPHLSRTVGAYLSFYGVTVFWHDSCGDMRAYFPDPNARRQMAFNIEPVSHCRIAPFSGGKWHHVRIAFDADGDRIEYFLDDMSDPALVVGDRSVWGAAEFMGGEIRIGGMGGSEGGVCSFKDIVLSEESDATTTAERTETLVFNGMGGDFFDVPTLLAADSPRVYTLDPTRSMYLPQNDFKYSKLPGRETLRRAKRIVLADAPAGPNGVLPDFILSDVVAAVSDGAELIVLGGFFSLSKGEYAETPLAKVLPDGALGKTPFDASPAAPTVLERSVGKGCVKVLTGFTFTNDLEETRGRFEPYAARLFGVR